MKILEAAGTEEQIGLMYLSSAFIRIRIMLICRGEGCARIFSLT